MKNRKILISTNYAPMFSNLWSMSMIRCQTKSLWSDVQMSRLVIARRFPRLLNFEMIHTYWLHQLREAKSLPTSKFTIASFFSFVFLHVHALFWHTRVAHRPCEVVVAVVVWVSRCEVVVSTYLSTTYLSKNSKNTRTMTHERKSTSRKRTFLSIFSIRHSITIS